MSYFTPQNRWQETRARIVKRDNFTCKNCRRSVKQFPNLRLEVHHELARWQFPHLTWEHTNLVTLCDRCHRRIERGVANDNRYQLPLDLDLLAFDPSD